MSTDNLLKKTETSKIRNEKIIDLIFSLDEKKIEVINTFNKNELNADKKSNDPIFIDFKKLYLLDLDPGFLWSLYKYRSASIAQHQSMKLSYFLWCKKNEDIFMKLLKTEIKSNIKYSFLLIMNSVIHGYKFDSYIKFCNENKDVINNILQFYLTDNTTSTKIGDKMEFKVPGKSNSIFHKSNLEYINKALIVHFLKFM